MKKNKSKEAKLALIHFLSEPDVVVTYWHIQKDIGHTRDEFGPQAFYTGAGDLSVQFYQKSKRENG